MDIGPLVEKAVRSISQETLCLGKGVDGEVYAVDDKVVLKLYNQKLYRSSNLDSALHEFEIGRDLHLRSDLRLLQLQIPYYYGLFPPQESAKLNYWGVFMERIYGVKFNDLSHSLCGKAYLQYKKQCRLVESLGYEISDSSIDWNTKFDLEKEKLFLFDLARWRKHR